MHLNNNIMFNLRSVIEKFSNPKIIITTHHKPDGDAMGSSLGLYNLLLNMGIDSQVITPSDYAKFLAWMPGNDKVLNFEYTASQCRKLVEQADIVFCLDFNKLSRINELGDYVQNSKALKVLIDHHQEPQQFDYMDWWDSSACSTCELIYRMAEAENLTSYVDANVARCLYTGIMTDTGGFRHRGTNANTHRIVAYLLDTGIDQTVIHEMVFDGFSEKRLKLIGFALSQRMEVLADYNAVLLYLTAQDLLDYDVKTGDTEGLVNYGLSIEGIKFSTLIIDRSVLVKMSFRAKGEFNVNIFARNHFSGGGHVSAAGGSSSDSIEETIDKFKNALTLYKNELQ